jgi:25S rRNA (cytosine2870-C5)-methyltransferase
MEGDEFGLSESEAEKEDGFGPDSEEDEEDDVVEDDGFDTTDDENDADVEMEGDELAPPHLRPNPTAEEGGEITTNLEDDLNNDGWTLPAVDGGEEEEEEGVSLRDVERRMRWLVEVLTPKEGGDKVAGLPGRSVWSGVGFWRDTC